MEEGLGQDLDLGDPDRGQGDPLTRQDQGNKRMGQARLEKVAGSLGRIMLVTDPRMETKLTPAPGTRRKSQVRIFIIFHHHLLMKPGTINFSLPLHC